MNQLSQGWRRLARGQKCVICGHAGWCTVSADKLAANCQRVPNSSPIISKKTNECVGYLHRLDENTPTVRVETPRPPVVRSDWAELAEQFASAAVHRGIEPFAESMGVLPAYLERLAVGWVSSIELGRLKTRCRSTGAWTFPMRDAVGKIIGIRLRDPLGKKYAITGSRSGLFIPKGIQLRDVVGFCEGPTTCAACLQIGYETIGRPSCSGGVFFALQLVRKFRPRLAIVFSENDAAKSRPDGSEFYPGQDGAREFHKALTIAGQRAVVIQPIAGKDMRDWLKIGASKAAVDFEIDENRT